MTEALLGSDLLAAIPELSPLDPHNQRLVENVHPPGWVNPDPKGRYNLVVVGAGTAGLVTAAGAAGLGARVALVERRLMGGDCLNVGCVPSKALIRAARAAAEVNRAGEFGVMVPGGARVNFARVQVVEQPGVFAAGDCAALREFPETPKAGVYAVRQGPVLASNLRALLDGRPLRRYRPQRDFLTLLNLADGTTAGSKWGVSFEGRWVMTLKDRIDRRFVARYRSGVAS